MARKKADPNLEENEPFEENAETEMMQTGNEAMPNDTIEHTAEVDAENPTEDTMIPGQDDNITLFLNETEDTRREAAASDDSANAESGVMPPFSEGGPNLPAEEKDESEYEGYLSEVSGLGLNNSAAPSPMILPENDGLSTDNTSDAVDDTPESDNGDQIEAETRSEAQRAAHPRRNTRKTTQEPRRDERILTIDAHDEVQSEAELEATRWHDVQNAYRTHRIVTGTLDSVERTENGMTVAVITYNGYRVAIPLKEMLLYSGRMPSGREYEELMIQLNRNLNARLGSEIDFMIKGIENKSRTIVASRKDAMLRKRQTFYFDTNEFGEPMIYEGRVVQARIVAVAEKIMRVEVFGVECAIRAPGMSWMWIGNARDYYNVGDRVLVRVLRISKPSVKDLKIEVDIRSVSSESSADNLSKCVVQGRYAGKVTDVRGGVVFIRLNNGVNAVAHSCFDARTPGKKDDVSFAVTRLDVEQGVAHGLITRIIRQNI